MQHKTWKHKAMQPAPLVPFDPDWARQAELEWRSRDPNDAKGMAHQKELMKAFQTTGEVPDHIIVFLKSPECLGANGKVDWEKVKREKLLFVVCGNHTVLVLKDLKQSATPSDLTLAMSAQPKWLIVDTRNPVRWLARKSLSGSH